MHPLYQRLRELDWDTFQKLCGQLLSAKHPGLEIRQVGGAGGDQGLDIFLGQLDHNPTVWQCKCFPNGLGAKQRPQAKESLRAAIKNFHPTSWILVVPIDLDTKAHVWFQKLSKAYAPKMRLGLFQASDIVRELIHRRDLRDAFFPGAVLDTVTVNRAISALGTTDTLQLQRLAAENFDELIARLEQEDARFSYQITYGPNVGSDIAQGIPKHPLLIASVGDDKKRIDVFARDLDAIRLNPPRVTFTLKDSGAKKISEYVRTGRQQELGPDEVAALKSTFDFLIPGQNIGGWKIVLSPSAALYQKRAKFRLTFTRDIETVRYEYVEFRIIRMGSEEVEMESVSNIPLMISLRLPMKEPLEATFRIVEKFEGKEVRTVTKALRTLSMLGDGADLEIYDLESGRSLGRLHIVMPGAKRTQVLEAVIQDASEIAEKFGAQLYVPDALEKYDFLQVAFLKALIDGSPLPIDSFSGQLVKGSSSNPSVVLQNAEFLDVLAVLPQLTPPPRLFGTSISTGAVTFMAEQATIVRAEAFWRNLERAKEGKAVPFTIKADVIRASLGQPSEFGFFLRPTQKSLTTPA